MTGSIRKRGNTHTALWSTVDPATGKRRQHSKGGFRTKRAAQEHLNTILGKVSEGSWRPDKPLTVKELLADYWLPAQRSRGLRPSTLDSYYLVVDHWLLPNIGFLRVSALTPKHVTDLVEHLRTARSSTGRQGLSGRSIQLAVGVLKAAYAWGVENGILARNPISGVKRPRATNARPEPWTVEEAQSFLASTVGDRFHAAWALLLTRGLRRGELCGLRWSDIDFTAGRCRITKTRVVVDGKALDSEPKTVSGKRSIPLDVHLLGLLSAHQTQQKREKLVAGAAYEDQDYVLADELGRPYHPDTISTVFERSTKALGLRAIRLHDTRHTAATLMLASGVPVKVVSEMLGHASPTITLSIYAHVLPGMAEEAGAAISAALLG